MRLHTSLCLTAAGSLAAMGTIGVSSQGRQIERVMRETNGNKVNASRKLGISRMQLYGRLRKYGLETQAV